jgi:acyl dehydratase
MLQPFCGEIPRELCEGAVAGLGERAGPVRAVIEAGLVPPDVLTGMTLHLLASQPRRPRPDAAQGAKKKGAIAGGVWVREQVTYHAPMRIGEEVTLTGDSVRRFARRGRRYGMNVSETRGEDGRLLVSSCTTGLLSYRKDPSLEDHEEGISEAELETPGPDPSAASSNPHLGRLHEVCEGDVLETGPVLVTLDMMRLRDAGRDDNPIHTDPTVARREGLAAPIAGGSHVLAFLQAALMEAWGGECLLHGAHFDVRWVGQTRADDHVTPRASVVEAAPHELRCELEIRGEDRPVVTGLLVLPLAEAR